MNRTCASLWASAAFITTLSLVPSAASATTIGECQGLIDTLTTATVAANFSGQNSVKDEANLTLKLAEARQKLDLAKLSDAAAKIGDYQAKLLQLVQAGKIAQVTIDGSPSFTDLNAGAGGVKTCIAAIGL